eukprot:m.7740 g.7740  ORF g.7740 m.7740 type:complete len:297 (+) comp6171_c0_seq2:88-978(+)
MPYVAPVCCGWNFHGYAKNPPSDNCGTLPMPKTTDGRYVGRRELLAHVGGRGCTCAKEPATERWRWESPSFPQFNATMLCELLGNRTMMFIGDSTMEQTASTVMNAVFAAGCQTQMSFGKADTLVGQLFGGQNRGRVWTSWIDEFNPDVVVVTAGPHIQHNSSFDMVFQEFLNTTLRYRESSPRRQIIWKTHQPAGCTSNISDGIHVNTSAYFNHGFFRTRDVQCIAKLKAHGLPYLDLQMLYNRSDGHIDRRFSPTIQDCLHMCVPGPLDVIPGLLQQVMQRLLVQQQFEKGTWK